jgi:hypothetical protein
MNSSYDVEDGDAASGAAAVCYHIARRRRPEQTVGMAAKRRLDPVVQLVTNATDNTPRAMMTTQS